MDEKLLVNQLVERGVMVMKDGKAWGITYEDGHSTSYGWMPPAQAPMHDPQFCKRPTDVTYEGSYLIPELQQGQVVHVERVTEVFTLPTVQNESPVDAGMRVSEGENAPVVDDYRERIRRVLPRYAR